MTTISKIERLIDSTGNNPEFGWNLLGYAYALEGNRDKALQIAGEMEARGLQGIDKIFLGLEDYDKTFDILNQAISNRSFYQMYVIKQAPWYDPIRDDPRFDQILTRMGLADQQLN